MSLALFYCSALHSSRGQIPTKFVINVKAPTGSRLEMTNQYVARVEDDIRQVIGQKDLKMIVSNIGLTPDLSSIYTSNSGQHTAFVQVSLAKEHELSTFAYMRRVQHKLSSDLPELSTYFQPGGLVDSVVNQGMPAPIDIQVSGNNQQEAYAVAGELAQKLKRMPNVSDVLIPQDLDYPGLQLNVKREMSARLGLSASDVVNKIKQRLPRTEYCAPATGSIPATATIISSRCSTPTSRSLP